MRSEQGIMVVSLSSWEILLAAQAGIMRQVENLKKGRKPYYGAGTRADWQLHIEGCLGEYALAKFLGLHWSGQGFRGDDVGRYQVRTGSQEGHRLILHPDDADDHIFWLLCGANGAYGVKGWVMGRDGKQDVYWKDPGTGRPAFFVPQAALSPPDALPTQHIGDTP